MFKVQNGDTHRASTLAIMTLRIMTFSIMTLAITTLITVNYSVIKRGTTHISMPDVFNHGQTSANRTKSGPSLTVYLT
jgi:hypothetical protein